MAARYYAVLDVVHCWNSSPDVPVFEAREASEASLRAFVDQVKVRGPRKLRRKLDFGDAAHSVMHRALRGGYGLLVVGTHRDGRPDRGTLGRVTASLVRGCPCPVLVVPPSAFLRDSDGAAGGNAVTMSGRVARLLVVLDPSTQGSAAMTYANAAAKWIRLEVASLPFEAYKATQASHSERDVLVVSAEDHDGSFGRVAEAVLNSERVSPVMLIRKGLDLAATKPHGSLLGDDGS
jgi:hypothetical protein